MACFLAPAAEAVVTTAIKKATDKKENKNIFLSRMNWLNNMLWGGSALLAFEHVWHGEVVPFFPFLTNAATHESAAMMLREIAVSGTSMAALVTAVWAGMVLMADSISKRSIDLGLKKGQKL